jgi:hypothetical protein
MSVEEREIDWRCSETVKTCFESGDASTMPLRRSRTVRQWGNFFFPWKSKTWILVDFLSKTRLAADLLGVFLELILGFCFRLD